MNKKIITNISFTPTDSGGRASPFQKKFKCPAFFENIEPLSHHGYDCRITFPNQSDMIFPGDSIVNVEIEFLSQEEVIQHLKVGHTFLLWEAKVIGRGVVVRIDSNTGETGLPE